MSGNHNLGSKVWIEDLLEEKDQSKLSVSKPKKVQSCPLKLLPTYLLNYLNSASDGTGQ